MKFSVNSRVCIVLVSILLFGALIGSGVSEAAVRDSINVAISWEVVTLDPKIGNDLGTFDLMAQIYDTLVRMDSDGAYVPGLATEWKVSEDGLEYTFTLRDGVKFHNGDTLTPDDVVFSFDRSAASPATSRITGAIAKTEKVDDKTVKVTLKYPYGPFIGCLTAVNLGVVSKRAVEEMGEEAFAWSPVGTGPYKVIRSIPGDRLIMESFPDYYRGEAAIKNLTYRIIIDPSTQVIALEQGEIDMVSVAPAEIPNVINNDKLFFDQTPQSRFLFIAFNNETGLFKNKLLREAVSYAVDREAILLGGAEGVGALVDAPIPANCFGYPVGFQAHPYDIEKAKALLEEAGYNNEPVKIRCIAGPTYGKPSEVLQDMMSQAGFNVELDMMENSAWLADVQTSGNYEITVTIMTALIPDADLITYTRFHSSMVGNGANFTYCNIPEMDEALDLGRRSMDPEERKAAYLKVSEIVRDQSVIIPVYSGMASIACDTRLKGVKASPLMVYNIYDLHWEE